MTHLLINNDGSMKHVDPSYSGISEWTEATLRCIDDWMDFMNSDEYPIFDLIEPSNTTLMYLAIALSKCIIADEECRLYIDEMIVNRTFLVIGPSIKPYIEFANQVLNKVNPESDDYAYSGNKALVAKKNAQSDLYARLQIIMEAIFFRELNHSKSLDIYVSQDFDIPHVLNMYANVSQWNDAQYEEYDRIVKEEMEKAKAEAQN